MARTVSSRLTRAKGVPPKPAAKRPIDTSDAALAGLLKRLKDTVDPAEIRELSGQIERVIFHKQSANA